MLCPASFTRHNKMDDDFGHIDIEGKNLAISTKDIDKLSTNNGCELQMVPGKVYNLDETVDSDAQDDNYFQNEFTNKLDKHERLKKEYIYLAMNADRDPIKPGKNSSFTEFQDNSDDFDFENTLIGDKSRDIHSRYDNIGSYEDYMKNNEFEEISLGRVHKRKLLPGVQNPVTHNSMVMYNCALWTEKSREPFDSTWLRNSVHVTNLATDSMLPGLYELLLTMKKGEICEAFLQPEAAFGQLGAKPRIPPNATIFCYVEIVRVVSEHKMSILTMRGGSAADKGLTFQDFYSASDLARQRGNYFYERTQFRTAIQRYKSGIRLLECLSYKNEEEETRAKGLLVKLYNNCARAANAAGWPRLALSACREVINIDDRIPKTYWHWMKAWTKRGHFDRALGVARRAMQLFPEPQTNRLFHDAARELKTKLERDQVESNELYRLMASALFTSSKPDGSSR